ncbi:trypsin-like peptidase domain-containing protein [Brevibacillus dissolubilis]|uniref:trypsin-like peptidase domain-containing protein n=1 Tax=Brevibacillus dissolubilis TaxID=1844116 RepID=UPI0011160A09|nr:trypsin-like peptidase domain-containing protein [Brevibacillus dissolubilis]
MFKDIESNRWSKDDIEFAVRMGFLQGFPDDTFRPTEFVTREQFAAILRRALLFPWSKVVAIAEESVVYLAGKNGDHGTGTIVQGNYIITAAHVIGDRLMMGAKLRNGQIYNAVLVKKHDKADLAILRLETPEVFPCLRLSENSDIKSTEEILTIGHPHNETWKACSGKISREQVPNQPWEFEMKLEVRSGNSGGPVINQQGDIIGVVVQTTGTELGEAISVVYFKDWIKECFQ